MSRKRKDAEQVPAFDKLLIPTVQALIELGGSGTIEEISEKVYSSEGFTEEILQISHGENGSRSEVDYRLAWARTYLKKFGLIENSARGVWTLTKFDINVKHLTQLKLLNLSENKRPKII
jgi:restriction system protein